MREFIKKLVEGENLTRDEAAQAMDMMLEGSVSEILTTAYLTALRTKGETVDEIVGSVTAMKEKGGSVSLSDNDYIDFVGTGGDAASTFNISTTASIICAAAGVTVAKHGNRAASSKSGAADLLEALGVNIMLEPDKTQECIEKIGIGFMNAQKFHRAMKNVAGIRSELGIRTIFNMLGPLSNPSNAKRQVIGVFDAKTVSVFSHVMKAMGVTDAVVVYGLDGMDEITTTTKTLVNEIKDGEITEYELDPADYGIPYAKPEDIAGGTGEENAVIARDIYNGKKGPKRDIVVLNAGMGIYIGKRAKSLAEGIRIAEETIDSGAAAKKLEEMIKLTNSMGV